jgi:hypothetical protein
MAEENLPGPGLAISDKGGLCRVFSPAAPIFVVQGTVVGTARQNISMVGCCRLHKARIEMAGARVGLWEINPVKTALPEVARFWVAMPSHQAAHHRAIRARQNGSAKGRGRAVNGERCSPPVFFAPYRGLLLCRRSTVFHAGAAGQAHEPCIRWPEGRSVSARCCRASRRVLIHIISERLST